MPSSSHNLRISAFGIGRASMPIMPPGACFGCPVPGTPAMKAGRGSSKMAVGNAAADGIEQVFHPFGRQRRRLDHQQHVVTSVFHRLGQVDFFHVVLFLEFFDDGLSRQLPGLAAGEREPAEQLGVGADHADRLALGLGHRVDRTNQFILDRECRSRRRVRPLSADRSGKRLPESIPRRRSLRAIECESAPAECRIALRPAPPLR